MSCSISVHSIELYFDINYMKLVANQLQWRKYETDIIFKDGKKTLDDINRKDTGMCSTSVVTDVSKQIYNTKFDSINYCLYGLCLSLGILNN
jgi:hypothetical protein